MKTTLKLLALLLAVGFPCVAFAEFIGAPLSASLNAESALVAFVLVVGGLILARDYSSALRPLTVKAPAPSVPQRRQAYGIRRSADVSRLAA